MGLGMDMAKAFLRFFMKVVSMFFSGIFRGIGFLYRKRLWQFIPLFIMLIINLWWTFLGGVSNINMGEEREEISYAKLMVTSKYLWIAFWFGAITVGWRIIRDKVRRTNPDFSFIYMIKWLFKFFSGKIEKNTNGINLKDKYNSVFSKKTANRAEVGTVFWGKQGKDYIARNIQTDNSGCGMLLVGSSGVGKSTCVIGNSLQLAKINEHILCIDVKGELQTEYRKTHPDARIITFRPKSTDTWNYDPMYRIDHNEDDNPTTEAQLLAGALIPLSGNSNSKYFEQSAQSMLAGALLYYHKVKGFDFSEVMMKVISTNPLDLVNEIMNDTDEKAKDAKICVNQFLSMKETEAGSIYSSLKNACTIYATDKNLQRVLSKSSNQTFKASDIETANAIFIEIDTKSINTTYASVCGIIVSQILDVLLERPESKEQDPVLLLLDEAPQYIASINSSGNEKAGKLETAFSVLRSKKCYILLAIQSLENLNRALGESQAKVLIDNAPWCCVMSVQDPTTQRYFADKLGKYDETQISQSNSQQIGTIGGSQSTSFSTQERYKIRPEMLSFLQSLPSPYGMGQSLLFHPQGATLVDKVPIFVNNEGKIDPLFDLKNEKTSA